MKFASSSVDARHSELRRASAEVISALAERRDKDQVTVGGIITETKRIRTRNGDYMMFATLDDLAGAVEMLVFGKTLAEYETVLVADEIVVGHVGDGQLVPAEVVSLLNKFLGSDTIVVADPGTPTPNVASFWDTVSPGRTVIAPRGHGPMGFAIPAAIGASFACPDLRILSVTADGSLAMSCGELETAEFKRQAKEFAQTWKERFGNSQLLELPSLNHYETIETFIDQKSTLSRTTFELFAI